MSTLKDKTVFITGATAGIGEASARRCAAAGARLVLLGRRAERLDALAKELSVPCHLIAADIRDREVIEKAIAELPADFAAVDVLINNAGLAAGLERAWETDPEDWETMVDTNIKGLMRCTRLLLPGMVERDRGHIVNVGSVAGSYPYARGNVYGATKSFVLQFSRNLRVDLLGKNIRVTNIEPGAVETEFSVVRMRGDQAAADRVYEGYQPLVAEDIAETIEWALTRPAHVNVSRIEVLPTMQAFGGFKVAREDGK
ncbi:MAG: SDR family NAD(P)-dependent oxidoreductase [Chrysiogenetes bacterium]|nr:SDR family NAD(P)-dependent oxidoreductase [Chrysiogenetes bacterium]